MATPETALDFLRDNLGMGETPPGSNCNWLTTWAGIGCVAWCSITMSRALNEAWGDSEVWQVPGVGADYRWGTAYVPNLRKHFIDAGMYSMEPKVGDVVIFTWGPGEPIGDHTGMVEQVVGDGTVVTLEGNHADDLVRMRRSMAVIDGFGHPPYSDTPAPTPPTPIKELTNMPCTYNYDGSIWAYGDNRLVRLTTPLQAEAFRDSGAKDIGDQTKPVHEFYSVLAGPQNVIELKST